MRTNDVSLPVGVRTTRRSLAHRLASILTGAAVSAAIAGCATDLNSQRQSAMDKHRAALEAQTSCCSSFGGMSFVDLQPDTEYSSVIDDETPAFLFPSGKSHFVAFTMPGGGTRAILEIGTYATGGWSQANDYYFLPSVMFLDSDKKLVQDSRYLTLIEPGWGRAQLDAEVHVPPEAKYAVIYADADSVDTTRREKSVDASASGAGNDAPVKAIIGPTIDVPYSFVGKLAVTYKPE